MRDGASKVAIPVDPPVKVNTRRTRPKWIPLVEVGTKVGLGGT